jgi:uncharacterized protein with HEPN domain
VRSDRERLEDILERCRLLREHIRPRIDEVESDPVLSAAAHYWIQTIGEAAANVSAEFRAAHPEVRWRAPIGMRQIMVHGYFHADLDVIRNVVLRDAPDLEDRIQAIVDEVE